MTVDTRGPRGMPGRLAGRRAAAVAAATLSCLFPLLVLLVSCAPAADPSEDAAQAPPPRITAEHPVTARPALEAGLVDGGAAGGGSVLGEAGTVDGLDGAAGSLVAILPADDVAESIDFYAGLLGFDVRSSEPAEAPFRRVELARGDVRLVLLGPEAWEGEMPRFGEGPVAGGAPTADEAEGDESAGDDGGAETGDGGTGDGGTGDGGTGDSGLTGDDGAGAAVMGGAGPVLRLALDDLATVADALTEAGLEVEVRRVEVEGSAEAPGRRLAVVDPAGNRLLLVPAGVS